MQTSIRYPFINQLTGPKGFWSHAGHVSFCKRIPAEMRSAVDCGHSEFNGVAPVVVTPAVPGPGVRIPKKSNLDLNGRSVKRGLLVSWGGLRFKVLRIEGGRAYYGDSFPNSVACGLVQVVQ